MLCAYVLWMFIFDPCLSLCHLLLIFIDCWVKLQADFLGLLICYSRWYSWNILKLSALYRFSFFVKIRSKATERIASIGLLAVMLSPRGQVGLEAKILSSSSSLSLKICPRPRPWPWVFVLDKSLTFSFGPCEIVCNSSIDSLISEFALVS